MLIREGERHRWQDWLPLVLDAFVASIYIVLKHVNRFNRVCDIQKNSSWLNIPPVFFILTSPFEFFGFHSQQ